jgi:hypothetical protein
MRNLPEDPSKLHSAGFTRATTKKT